MEILALSELPVPPPDRATLRRFRHVVADLGSDFYVATIDERLVGVVHATYARQIATYPVARIELLAVAPDARRQEVGRSMVHHIAMRARKRSCVRLSCDLTALTDGQRGGTLAFFARENWDVSGVLATTSLTGLPESAA